MYCLSDEHCDSAFPYTIRPKAKCVPCCSICGCDRIRLVEFYTVAPTYQCLQCLMITIPINKNGCVNCGSHPLGAVNLCKRCWIYMCSSTRCINTACSDYTSNMCPICNDDTELITTFKKLPNTSLSYALTISRDLNNLFADFAFYLQLHLRTKLTDIHKQQHIIHNIYMIMSEYFRWLVLLAESDKPLDEIPSILIADVWRAHLILTDNYSRICRLAFGKMIHHKTIFHKTEEIRNTKFMQTFNKLNSDIGKTQYFSQLWCTNKHRALHVPTQTGVFYIKFLNGNLGKMPYDPDKTIMDYVEDTNENPFMESVEYVLHDSPMNKNLTLKEYRIHESIVLQKISDTFLLDF